ncbi:carbohydrate ABC transporter substrate-binding protein [Deinococcus detaillensis]|uniref:Carbohydrate ABC transporter substrate-binding protein n=1 Tax=Deinococcus detaillensis TaxID=2592048 RepID=A0A553V1S6_9DEIO|nr:ABC transporter substrate-binding protein [Deinococcus detaillensis]TSA86457.1 carbohydrate ABC transporter substrate-binding protein [Deinococcus detaillensis]
MKKSIKNALVITAALGLTAQALAAGKIEIFSWWAGDEGPALAALIKLYEAKYPSVKVDNAAVTGGAGTNAKAVLKTRMLGGDPPDSFQAHAGQELTGTWVVANRMEDLSSLYKSEGWSSKFPKAVIDLISYKGGIYSVPVDVHRSNVMWYVPANLKKWGVSAPKTWPEVLSACTTLKAKGVAAPMVMGENWTEQMIWESVATAMLGPKGWNDLWSGKLKFTDPKVVDTFTMYGKVLDCANKDASGLSWQQATDRLLSGQSAFNIMGDWAAGYMTTTKKLKPGSDFAWSPSPGTSGTFIMLADSFGLPKGVKNRAEVLNWLKVLGSKQGQDAFNPLKGSIAARTDSDLSKYGAYSQSAAKDWKNNTIVGSMVHGAAAPESFTSGFGSVNDAFLSNHDAKAAAQASQDLADKSRIGM